MAWQETAEQDRVEAGVMIGEVGPHGEEGAGGADDARALALAQRIGSRGDVSARLDLDEDEDAPAPDDEVDLAPRKP
jgi:hypothetical protein